MLLCHHEDRVILTVVRNQSVPELESVLWERRRQFFQHELSELLFIVNSTDDRYESINLSKELLIAVLDKNVAPKELLHF